MGEKNQYGLDRYIPTDIRREIRRRCGFGCVRCGLAIYDYEHFAPDFKDAKIHDPNGMTLLCPQCNQKRARGTLSAETVARANENPKCKQQGFASELFDFGPEPIEVRFAGVKFYNCKILIQVCGVDVLSFAPPEEVGGPMLMSGELSDCTGATTIRIEKNVWYAGDENWDVEVKGPCLIIRRGIGEIALQIRVFPPHALAVERIEMKIGNYFLRGNERELLFSSDGFNWGRMRAVSISHCGIGISLS